MRKINIIIVFILIIFIVYIIVEVSRSTKISDHIHSIDDKPSEQRSDDERITVLERDLQREPKNINVMFELTDLYMKTNQKSKAEDMVEEILEIDPANEKAKSKLNSIKSQ